ncbi:MAG: phosphodiester glycosidase family protein [Tabrizicola sp.]|uniref:phosphodiester glycosidase family protein n=1 Tax=Tabrizicola sp. TaxID=2005166 RepID=UPI002ABA876D|nr:phosphodiester glycosidase family protein [Tabrizicola sp.]MDZ4088673.1 phosphodiester glycosidase family protein [Tabrizicola sp.]
MRLLALAFLVAPVAAEAAGCRDTSFEGASYTLCEVTLGEDLRLFHSGPDGAYGSFRNVDAALGAEGKALGFAMNAGMYHRDLAPVGLYVEEGVETSAIVTSDGPGNFGLLPNGVFCIDDGFRVIESRTFKRDRPECRYATQSGPMLVIDGQLHPKLLPGSDSTYIRNGVGVSEDGKRAVFAISNDEVNFHSFARLFRDELGLFEALYFDGNISRLYAPALDRHDGGFPMGPIVGTVVPKD